MKPPTSLAKDTIFWPAFAGSYQQNSQLCWRRWQPARATTSTSERRARCVTEHWRNGAKQLSIGGRPTGNEKSRGTSCVGDQGRCRARSVLLFDHRRPRLPCLWGPHTRNRLAPPRIRLQVDVAARPARVRTASPAPATSSAASRSATPSELPRLTWGRPGSLGYGPPRRPRLRAAPPTALRRLPGCPG
jgi:hypothetical protein